MAARRIAPQGGLAIDVAKAARLRAQGLRLAVIAQRLGCSPNGVSHALARHAAATAAAVVSPRADEAGRDGR